MFRRRRLDVGAPARSLAVEQARFLAVDFETTGTDPRRDAVVSMGWVPVDGGEIVLGEAGYHVVSGAQVGDSALIHGLTDAAVERGAPATEVLPQLLEALRGRVLLAHFAALEVGFVERLCQEQYGKRPQLQVVDTFALERRHMERMGTYPRGEDLRLARVRQRYGLPRYGNHNALTDALACAELFLAQVTQTRAQTLADIVS
ncbi:DNA polymerase III subunit epsilon [Corynebacterium lizhenjunii]|uniref:DNA polymerase III subunit epsilon n=1 Tax=Corynebacterium lizhenjunii TaxID=2709394 RepID=A0A7T0KHZ1_9CORY|nr:exonuclease domain-containing protein [Corynebacterium lizhenjunii]QPK80058.1 DNA polymerase III subunit epsilon [Corynebacterium lizhenjunii]